MRLIDADELKHRMETVEMYGLKGLMKVAREMVIESPTVDAVEVVRCKDCRWGREACGNIECSADLNLPPEYHGYEWFCPNGERKENETD